MLVAITREVSVTLSSCELTFIGRGEIDISKARKQHAAYRMALIDLDVQVRSLPAQDMLPDAVFVEDGAVVVDEVAVLTTMGTSSRALETETLAPVLAEYRELRKLHPPATLDGGDVLQIGRKIYVGLSRRTNLEGIDQLRDILSPHGYSVGAVGVNGCLHLKTGVGYLGENAILCNPEWVDTNAFNGLKMIRVPREEPWASNVLSIHGTVLVPSSFVQTHDVLRKAGFNIKPVEVSEFQKAEGGLTCLSIILGK